MEHCLLKINLYNAVVDNKKIKEVEKFFAVNGKGFKNVKFYTDERGHLKDIELDDYFQIYEDKDIFMNKLSESLLKGYVTLIFEKYNNIEDEDNTIGYEIYAKRIEKLTNIFIPDKLVPSVLKLINNYKEKIMELK